MEEIVKYSDKNERAETATQVAEVVTRFSVTTFWATANAGGRRKGMMSVKMEEIVSHPIKKEKKSF